MPSEHIENKILQYSRKPSPALSRLDARLANLGMIKAIGTFSELMGFIWAIGIKAEAAACKQQVAAA